MNPQGRLCLVLHAHLPYVRHPDHESFLEETWLFEAIAECYVPLIRLLDRLLSDKVPARLTLSLSPTLTTMLRDPLLQERFLAHMDTRRRLAEAEVIRTRGDERFAPLAALYRGLLDDAVDVFERWNRDLSAAFAHHRDAGLLELVTTAATHAFLPLFRADPRAARAQLVTGAREFRAVFGEPAAGVWLPECGYHRGLEETVEEAGFGWFIVDTHAIVNAEPRPMFGTSAPLVLPNGVAVFGRDPSASRRVWSGDEGYPGDPWYRDFHRDIGFDLPLDHVRPFILDGSKRVHTGFKYHRVTDRSSAKEVYEPIRAAERVAAHVEHFCAERRRMIELEIGWRPGPEPVITAPFDAELFGHWWFEGPQWLEGVLRTLSDPAGSARVSTPSEYLAANTTLQRAVPSPSSWGDGGYNGYWLNPSNDWIYPQLDGALRRMTALARGFADEAAASLKGRAVRQAARELLLAQASDWPFIMKSGTGVEYASGRLRDHLGRFHYLENAVRGDSVNERSLRALEFMDDIFPGIDPGLFA